eukprot:scaffold1089_cov53-Attheya_sp.AAC.2
MIKPPMPVILGLATLSTMAALENDKETVHKAPFQYLAPVNVPVQHRTFPLMFKAIVVSLERNEDKYTVKTRFTTCLVFVLPHLNGTDNLVVSAKIDQQLQKPEAQETHDVMVVFGFGFD